MQALGGEIFLIGPVTDEKAMELTEKTKAAIPEISKVCSERAVTAL